MKYPLYAVVVALLSTVALAATAGETSAAKAAPLTVEVVDLRNTKGHLRLGIFDQPKGFPKSREGAILWRTLPASTARATFQLELPPGEYAVVVLHDENGNKKVDRNFLGIPKEGYGVSNNPKPATRAARYDEARFTHPPEGTGKRVSIQYF